MNTRKHSSGSPRPCCKSPHNNKSLPIYLHTIIIIIIIIIIILKSEKNSSSKFWSITISLGQSVPPLPQAESSPILLRVVIRDKLKTTVLIGLLSHT